MPKTLPVVTCATTGTAKTAQIAVAARTPNTCRLVMAVSSSGSANVNEISRNLPHANISKLDRRSFRFKTEIPGSRLGAGAARDFFTVDPQAHFAVDAAHVVMIPLTHTAA